MPQNILVEGPPVPRLRRPLPAEWTHRTAQRVFAGPLHPALAASAAPGSLGQPKTAEIAGRQFEAPSAELPPEMALAARPAHRQSSLQVLWVLTRTDFRARYRSQALGLLWSLLNPLVMMCIISLVFTHLFRSTERYFPIFLLIGLLVWQWVTGSLTAATNVFVSNADIIKRTIFLRQLLPISMILSYGINFCIESLALLIFLPIFPGAFKLSPALLLVPILLGLLGVLLSGIALAISVLNVIYRDVAYLVNTALLILYWLTPLVYPLDVIPYPFRTLLKCSPLAGIIMSLRRAIMLGEAPSLLGWAAICLPTALVVLFGWRIYRHYEHMVLDYV